MDRCIIVQGPTYDHSINQIKECFKGFPVIYSTWKGYESWYGDGDLALFSHTPNEKGVQNVNYQKVSTIAGLHYAKELGYKRALKWRSDMWTDNAVELMRLFTQGYNTLCWNSLNGGYLTDYFMEGSISTLLEIWDINVSGPYPERMLTDKINSLGLFPYTNLVLEGLGKGVDIWWNKEDAKYWLSSVKELEEFKTNTEWKTLMI